MENYIYIVLSGREIKRTRRLKKQVIIDNDVYKVERKLALAMREDFIRGKNGDLRSLLFELSQQKTDDVQHIHGVFEEVKEPSEGGFWILNELNGR